MMLQHMRDCLMIHDGGDWRTRVTLLSEQRVVASYSSPLDGGGDSDVDRSHVCQLSPTERLLSLDQNWAVMSGKQLCDAFMVISPQAFVINVTATEISVAS